MKRLEIMSQIEKDKAETRFNGVLFCIIGAIVVISAFFADTVWTMVLGVVVGLFITACGIWMVKTKKVYWSVSQGFTPKGDGQGK